MIWFISIKLFTSEYKYIKLQIIVLAYKTCSHYQIERPNPQLSGHYLIAPFANSPFVP